MLYLEAALFRVKSVMSVRRILYLYKILTRHKEEIIVRVYSAMNETPLNGDWIHTGKRDMEEIHLNYSDEEIAQFSI